MGRAGSGQEEALLIEVSPNATEECDECGYPLVENFDGRGRCFDCNPCRDDRRTFVVDEKGRIFWGGNVPHDEIRVAKDFEVEIARGEIEKGWGHSFQILPSSNLSPEQVARLLSADRSVGGPVAWSYTRYLPAEQRFERGTVSA